jgi:hypothetical protein
MKCRACDKRWRELGPIGITLEGMTEEETAMWEKANELAALERELQRIDRRQAICIQSIKEARKAMGCLAGIRQAVPAGAGASHVTENAASKS